MNFSKIVKTIFKNFPKLIKERKKYKEIKTKIIEDFNQWENRLNGENFHGGKSPDEADFALYALLKTKHNSISFKRFLENEIPRNAYSWFIRMQVNCKYDEDRLMMQ